MVKSLAALLLLVTIVAGSAFLFNAPITDSDPYPTSLAQLQAYSPDHDFAGRAVLVSGTLERAGDDFAISDDIDGQRWSVRLHLHSQAMRDCVSTLVGHRFVISDGFFFSDAELDRVQRVIGGDIVCIEE